MRTCLVYGCTSPIGAWDAVCENHWQQLPQEMQASLWNTNALGRAGSQHRHALHEALLYLNREKKAAS